MSHVIALVDDDRNILTSVSIALQAEGFLTRVYSDGQAALKAFADNPPDLGVFDIKMPQMDGMELLRRVREMGGRDRHHAGHLPDLEGRRDRRGAWPGDGRRRLYRQAIFATAADRAHPRHPAPAGPGRGASSTAAAGTDAEELPLLERGRLAMDPARHKVAVGRRGRRPDRHRVPDPGGACPAPRRGQDRATNCSTSPIRTMSMSTTARSTATSSASAANSAASTPNSMQSRPYMASDTDSARNEDADLALTWSGRWTLAHRILAVNVLTLALVALAIALSRQLPKPPGDRAHPARSNAKPAMAATRLPRCRPDSAKAFSPTDRAHERQPDCDFMAATALAARQLAADRPDLSPARPDHAEMDQGCRPRARPRVQCARRRAKPADDFVEPADDRASAWPEASNALRDRANRQRKCAQAPDLTPVLSSAAPVDWWIDPAGHRQ